MRLIDADAFAEFLKDAIKQQKYEDTKIDGLLTVADVIEAVITELDGTSFIGFKNAPTIEPQRTGQWIPCGERLPEDVKNGEEYPTLIYCTDGGEVDAGWYEAKVHKWWNLNCDVTVDNVIAWMPLPEPYKPDDFSQHMNPPED